MQSAPAQNPDPVDDLTRIVGEWEPEPPRQDLSFPRRRGGQRLADRQPLSRRTVIGVTATPPPKCFVDCM
jgi:hypothetical protein